MKSLPRNAYVEGPRGHRGPVLGSVGALVCLVVAWSTGSSSGTCGVHRLPDQPVQPDPGEPFDGGGSSVSSPAGSGQDARSGSPLLATRSPILLLIPLLGLFSLPRVVRNPRAKYFDVPSSKRIAINVAYFELIATLSVAIKMAERPLENLRTPHGRSVVGLPHTARPTTINEPADPMYSCC
jgi:hypothetical protein